MAVIAVLGAGMMGTALCVPMCDRGHEVRLVGTHLDRDIIEQLRSSNTHPGIAAALPTMLYYQTEELEQAMQGSHALALGVSSAGVKWAAQQVQPYLEQNPNLPVCFITKGLDWEQGQLHTIPSLLKAHWPQECEPVAITGPCIAGELARRVETAVVFAGHNSEQVERWADWLRTEYYFIQPSKDVMGAEICAALKNAFAMAIGFAAGVHESRGGQSGSVAMHNYESAVYTQAAQEMAKLVQLFGGQPASIWGLPGMGDLLVTCSGGRTSRLGRWLGLGLNLDQAVEKMQGATLESLDILRVMARVVPDLEASGQLQAEELPLLRHLIGIVTQGEHVQMPFASFFGG